MSVRLFDIQLRLLSQSTRALQKVLSLGSDYFSGTFYQTYFFTNFQSIPPLLKHIFVTFLPSRENQIKSSFGICWRHW